MAVKVLPVAQKPRVMAALVVAAEVAEKLTAHGKKLLLAQQTLVVAVAELAAMIAELPVLVALALS